LKEDRGTHSENGVTAVGCLAGCPALPWLVTQASLLRMSFQFGDSQMRSITALFTEHQASPFT
jgi:hypothetical protein